MEKKLIVNIKTVDENGVKTGEKEIDCEGFMLMCIVNNGKGCRNVGENVSAIEIAAMIMADDLTMLAAETAVDCSRDEKYGEKLKKIKKEKIN